MLGLGCLFAGAALAAEDTLELLVPPTAANSKPFAQFRARKPSPDPQSYTGHVFVVLGRELDNGTKYFYGAAGFYPEKYTIKNMLSGPGKVDYQIADFSSDITFTVKISSEQERTVKYIIQNYPAEGNYSLVQRNCITMFNDVARALGLTLGAPPPAQTPGEPPGAGAGAAAAGAAATDLLVQLPYKAVQGLASLNDENTALRHALDQSKKEAASKAAAAADALATVKHMIDRQRQVDEAAGFSLPSGTDLSIGLGDDGGGGIQFGEPFGGATGSEQPSATLTTTMPATWPWKAPE
jgi:hypothetical protein